MFVLNKATGVISRSMTKALDRETKASYTLNVNASDSAGNTVSKRMSSFILGIGSVSYHKNVFKF
jgi:hypothetical protein